MEAEIEFGEKQNIMVFEVKNMLFEEDKQTQDEHEDKERCICHEHKVLDDYESLHVSKNCLIRIKIVRNGISDDEMRNSSIAEKDAIFTCVRDNV